MMIKKDLVDFEREIDVFIVDDKNEKKRLDVFVSEQYRDMSRSTIQKFIKEDRIIVNSKVEKASYKVCLNDLVQVEIPEPEELNIEAQDIKINIIHEDDDILVVNKEQGMVVHPAPGNYDKTLVNAIMYHCRDNLSSINGVIRPGIVHRIDKNTSGLLVIAKKQLRPSIFSRTIRCTFYYKGIRYDSFRKCRMGKLYCR